MNSHVRHVAVLLCPLFLVAACGSGQQNTAHRLDDRLALRMAPDLAAGNAALQATPDGARVTLLGASPFSADENTLDDRRPDVRAGVIEGLLDPRLMRIQVEDTSLLPADQREARVRNVARYFEAYGLEPMVAPVGPPQATPPGAPPSGLTISIAVQCPPSDGIIGYGDGTSNPVCD
jgi:hypothetical protein